MNAGLPGAGIGGVFYLVLALFMPFLELYKTIKGESSLKRWGIVVRQLVMAGSILAGMWLMGLFLGVLLTASGGMEAEKMSELVQIGQIGQVGQIGWIGRIGQVAEIAKLNIFHIAPVIMSLMTLSVILILTQILVLLFRPSATR